MLQELSNLIQRDRGAVVVTVALLMPLLLLLTSGGIVGLAIYGTHLELQKAADQAALAGASSLPPFAPDIVLDNSTFPMAGTTTATDPRTVACKLGNANLTGDSAGMVASFGSAPTSPPPTVCTDSRIRPSFTSKQHSSCTVGISSKLESDLRASLSGVLGPADLEKATEAVMVHARALVTGLNLALPTVFTPEFTVDVETGVRPPMYSLVSNDESVDIGATATAARRLKNAITFRSVSSNHSWVSDPAELNKILGNGKTKALHSLNSANTHLNSFLTAVGGSATCQDLLSNLERDLDYVAVPIDAPNPTVADVLEGSSPGDTFFVMGPMDSSLPNVGNLVSDSLESNDLKTEAKSALGTLRNVNIPVFDVAIATFAKKADGSYTGTLVPAANVRGAFQARLIK